MANEELLLIGAEVEGSVGAGDGGLKQGVFRGDCFRGGGFAVGVEAGEGDAFVVLDFTGFWMEEVGEEGDGGAIAEDPEVAGHIDGGGLGDAGVAGITVGEVPFDGLGGEG